MRYPLLDAFRGGAALAVAIFHCSNSMVRPGSSWFGDLLLLGWAGVFVFFPISGYCIAAAISRADGIAAAEFVRRRWRRIFPPYWASIALTLTVGLLALMFNRGSIQQLLGYETLTWAAVLTLTQTLIGRDMVINPVYWSLCYEEQFYLVMSLGLLISDRARWHLWAAVSAAAAIYVVAVEPSLHIRGVFLEHWLEFALGMAVYAWFHRPHGRTWLLSIGALTAATLAGTADPVPLTISCATTMLMMIARPHERKLLDSPVIRGLAHLGLFSFSLYLIHIPIGGRVVNLLRRVAPDEWNVVWIMPLGVGVSIVAAWVFYHVVEKHFLNRTRRVDPAVAEPLAA